jgi:Tol biopolymer transport system component
MMTMRWVFALALAIVLVSFTFACGGGGGPPEPAPIPGEAIAFVGTKIGSLANIYLVNADGSGFGQLTESTEFDAWPVWSPDGRRLAYFSWNVAQMLTPSVETATAEAATSTPGPETLTPGVETATAEAATSTPEPETLTPEELAQRRLLVRDLASGEDTMVADSLPVQGYSGPFGWSPDGSQIVYMAIADPTQIPVRAGIWSVDVGTGVQTPLAESQMGFLPAWSPDGTKIAFIGWIGEPDEFGQQESELFVMDSDGRNVRQLASRPGPDVSPQWSPDSRRIAWWGWGPGDEPSNLFMVDVESGELTGLGLGSDPIWSPDSRHVLFVQEQEIPGVITTEANTEIFVLDVETGERINLSSNDSPDLWPTWSPDGSRIAFVSKRDHLLGEIYVMDADGSNVKRITDNDLQEAVLTWSPR